MTAAVPTLEVAGLTKTFRQRVRLFGRDRWREVPAVQDVSFTVDKGETLGLVGESGSGKSTTARLLLRLIEPTSGEIRLDGRDLASLRPSELRLMRSGMQMVFQDPFASLNPRLSVGYQLAEPLIVHGLCGKAEARERVAALLERVGLNPGHARAYPHQFSGGQRQRIAIARALAVAPDLIVADEAVSALDVSVRAQILNLIADIREEQRLSIVFISHDLGVVWHIADRVAVMYRGRIVESGPVRAVFAAPRHPYTRELLDAMPLARPDGRPPRKILPSGAATSAPGGEGCAFAPRCRLAANECRMAVPPLVEAAPGHASACFRTAEVPAFRPDAGAPPAAAETRLRRLQQRFLAGGHV